LSRIGRRASSFCFKSLVFYQTNEGIFAMGAVRLAISKIQRKILVAAALIAALFAVAVQAQTAPPESAAPAPAAPAAPPPRPMAQGPAGPEAAARARIVVVGEGSVTVAPDYARIRSGVTTDAKAARQASDANAKLMSAVIQALLDFGIARKDIQTAQFSIAPIYSSQSKVSGTAESKLSGYRVSNQVNVTIRQIAQVGDVLDRLIEAGATDAGNVAFLVSDREKALDQAREAAIANARRKAELYARASGLALGRVVWITESSEFEPFAPMVGRAKLAAPAQHVPIESGEDTITAQVTVGFDIAQ
jgi:uncharacterized protein YggE